MQEELAAAVLALVQAQLAFLGLQIKVAAAVADPETAMAAAMAGLVLLL